MARLAKHVFALVLRECRIAGCGDVLLLLLYDLPYACACMQEVYMLLRMMVFFVADSSIGSVSHASPDLWTLANSQPASPLPGALHAARLVVGRVVTRDTGQAQ
jgi:hypothetical protein